MSLFSSYRLGRLELPNRIVMAPMTRCRALGGVPNALMREYYAQRASAGLIITEGTSPSPNGLGYARIPGLYSPEQVAGWRSVVEGVHAAGGRIFVQLMHVGRIAHQNNLPSGARILAPSAVASAGNMWTDQAGLQPLPTPTEMTAADLREALDEFVQGARNALAAGFDGVELHAANGYLLEQFLHPHTNRRSDDYGGSIERRIRFVVEVVRASAEVLGAERVGVRLSPHGTFNDLPAHAEVEATYTALARELRGVVYLHVINHSHAAFGGTAAAIRAAFGGPIIVNGGYDRERADAVLAAKEAELVAFGKPFISNPDLVRRFERQGTLAEAQVATFYTAGAEGYADYPAFAG
jgi:N-ethylmaleimide reductase